MFGLWGKPPFVTFVLRMLSHVVTATIASWKYFEGKDSFLTQPFKAKGRLWKQIVHFIQL